MVTDNRQSFSSQPEAQRPKDTLVHEINHGDVVELSGGWRKNESDSKMKFRCLVTLEDGLVLVSEHPIFERSNRHVVLALSRRTGAKVNKAAELVMPLFCQLKVEEDNRMALNFWDAWDRPYSWLNNVGLKSDLVGQSAILEFFFRTQAENLPLITNAYRFVPGRRTYLHPHQGVICWDKDQEYTGWDTVVIPRLMVLDEEGFLGAIVTVGRQHKNEIRYGYGWTKLTPSGSALEANTIQAIPCPSTETFHSIWATITDEYLKLRPQLTVGFGAGKREPRVLLFPITSERFSNADVEKGIINSIGRVITTPDEAPQMGYDKD